MAGLLHPITLRPVVLSDTNHISNHVIFAPHKDARACLMRGLDSTVVVAFHSDIIIGTLHHDSLGFFVTTHECAHTYFDTTNINVIRILHNRDTDNIQRIETYVLNPQFAAFNWVVRDSTYGALHQPQGAGAKHVLDPLCV